MNSFVNHIRVSMEARFKIHLNLSQEMLGWEINWIRVHLQQLYAQIFQNQTLEILLMLLNNPRRKMGKI